MSSSAPANIDLNADIKSTIIGPVIALMVLSAAAVALRIVSKWSIQMKKLQVDDYFIVAALVSYISARSSNFPVLMYG